MADVKYLEIPVDLFDSEPIKLLEKLPGADGNTLLYLELLCHAYRNNKHGVFSVGNIILTDAVLSSIFNYDNIGVRLESLEFLGLIKRNAQSIQVLRFWDDFHDRNSAQYREWRSSVFLRDGFRCVKCGTKKDIQAHHIKAWKKNKQLRYVIDNGVTLCRKCHLEAHGGCWKNG